VRRRGRLHWARAACDPQGGTMCVAVAVRIAHTQFATLKVGRRAPPSPSGLPAASLRSAGCRDRSARLDRIRQALACASRSDEPTGAARKRAVVSPSKRKGLHRGHESDQDGPFIRIASFCGRRFRSFSRPWSVAPTCEPKLSKISKIRLLTLEPERPNKVKGDKSPLGLEGACLPHPAVDRERARRRPGMLWSKTPNSWAAVRPRRRRTCRHAEWARHSEMVHPAQVPADDSAMTV
jgi:hypothetical protein